MLLVAHRQSFRQPAFADPARGEPQTPQTVIGKPSGHEERLHGSADDFDKCAERVCMVPGRGGIRLLCNCRCLSVRHAENDFSQKNNAISLLIRT